jgi:putative ABC transport system permease protein
MVLGIARHYGEHVPAVSPVSGTLRIRSASLLSVRSICSEIWWVGFGQSKNRATFGPPSASNEKTPPMFRNYLKLAFRNLARQKAFSFINITGLAVGLASSLIIFLWVQDEISFDRFHQKADRTYRLTAEASDLRVAITPAPVAPALKEAMPEIEHTVRLWTVSSAMMQTGDMKFEEKEGFYTEPSFFEVFDFPLLKGNAKTALEQPNGIILTEELARKYFGTTDALGKILRIDNKDDFTVTGILAPAPGNSHLKFDFLLPWAAAATWYQNIKENIWDNFDFYSYITFSQHSEQQLSEFEETINHIYSEHEKELDVEFQLQPLKNIHLHSNFMADVAGHGNFQYVAVLTIIAVFIVIIGCINFMNLSTARSARRAKEVGLRKVAGAVRIQLIKQFLGESILLTAIALIAALLIVALALPAVNDLVGKQLFMNFGDPIMMGCIFGITLITGVFSGIYPAFILSAFTPIKVLKKDVKAGAGGTAFRNVLVIAQFVISIVLLVGTSVVYQQLRYIQSRDLGFDKENLLYVTLHGDVSEKINTFRNAFHSNPLTADVTIASGLPTNHVSGTTSISWQGKDPDNQVIFAQMFIDENFIPVYGMELAAGRNFQKDLLGDSTNFIINEKAAALMGFTPESAIGQPMTLWDYRKGVITGVVKDFNFKPLQEAIEPLLLVPNTWGGIVVVKTQPNRTPETIHAMEEVWNSLENIYPFSYNFVDQDLENLYKSEKQVGTLFSVFALLAIMISCLGLYGLSSYIAEQRTREIGIRKALGASITNIMYMLNSRFVIPVILAMIIAAPIAWYSMNKWLDGFAYKITFDWMLVLIAGGIALTISLLTVSYESLKAAKVNPVKSLRSE